jgi:hypothetical protein
MILLDLLKAARYGDELKDPASWKKGQLLTNAVGGLILLAIKYAAPEYSMPPEMLSTATEAMIAIMVGINLYITKASSKKI